MKAILIAALVVSVIGAAAYVGLSQPLAGESTGEATVKALSLPIPIPEPLIPEPIEPIIKPVERGGVHASLLKHHNFVEAGGTIVLKGVVRNLGDSEITVRIMPIQEEIWDEDDRVIDPDWVSVSPSEIILSGGSEREFKISVSVPEGTKVGYYSGILAIRTERYPEDRLYYSIQVFKPLKEPVVREFSIPTNASKLLVKVQWGTGYADIRMRDYADTMRSDTNVDVHLYNPQGVEVPKTAETTKINGYVDVFVRETTDIHAHEEYEVTYIVERPASGTWRLEMMPKHVMHFSYEIIVNPIEF